jgi:hypothetical protein
VNKALLDTDILSEVGKGIDQTIARNATAYRQAYGLLTLCDFGNGNHPGVAKGRRVEPYSSLPQRHRV